MAGNNGRRNGPNPAFFWTRLDHMMLELAMLMHSDETEDRWAKIAASMGGGRTEAEVRAQYRYLVESGRLQPPPAEEIVDEANQDQADQAPAPAQGDVSASCSSSASGSGSNNGSTQG